MPLPPDSEQLKQELRDFDGHYSNLMARLGEARVKAARLDQTFKRLKYAVEKGIRDYYKSSFDKKPTEDSIKADVMLDPRVTAAQDALLEASEEVILLEAQRESAQVKQSLLVQLSAIYRTELETLRFSSSR